MASNISLSVSRKSSAKIDLKNECKSMHYEIDIFAFNLYDALIFFENILF